MVGHDVRRLVQAEHLLVHLLAHAVHAVAVHKGRVDDHGELAFEVEPDGQGAAAHLRTALRVEGRHEGVVQRQHVLQLVVAQSEPESTSQPLATRHRIICTTLFHLAPFIPVLCLFLLLYADDTIVLAECPEDLQRALDIIKIYCELWGLDINVRKTSHDIFKGEDQKNAEIQF